MPTNLHDGKGLWHAVMVLGLIGLLGGCASTTATKSSGNARIDSVTETAQALDGTPYCYAGSTPDCFDCSGFTTHCYATIGIILPRSSREQYSVGERVVDGLRAGDLVFFKTNGTSVSHVGIYLENERFIHASTSSGVMVSLLTDRYWQPRYLGARRVLE